MDHHRRVAERPPSRCSPRSPDRFHRWLPGDLWWKRDQSHPPKTETQETEPASPALWRSHGAADVREQRSDHHRSVCERFRRDGSRILVNGGGSSRSNRWVTSNEQTINPIGCQYVLRAGVAHMGRVRGGAKCLSFWGKCLTGPLYSCPLWFSTKSRMPYCPPPTPRWTHFQPLL